MQQDNPRQDNSGRSDSREPNQQPKEQQEKTDPQLTELKGFIDPKEDLEPTLADGTKAPDKEPPPNVNE